MTNSIHTSLQHAAILGLATALVSCAGSTPPAEEPAPEPMMETPAPEPEPEPVAEEAAEEPAPEESSDPATPDDVKAALTVVIQDDALTSSLKLEEPGRFPLKISGSGLPSGFELVVLNEPVEILSSAENAKETPVLVFTKIDITGNSGTVKYRYDIEGVRGTSHVVRTKDGRWELKSSRLTEY